MSITPNGIRTFSRAISKPIGIKSLPKTINEQLTESFTNSISSSPSPLMKILRADTVHKKSAKEMALLLDEQTNTNIGTSLKPQLFTQLGGGKNLTDRYQNVKQSRIKL